jgi:hypothetical protein
VRETFVLGVHNGHGAGVVLLKNGKVIERLSETGAGGSQGNIGDPKKSLDTVALKYSLSAKNIAVIGIPKKWGSPAFSHIPSTSDTPLSVFTSLFPMLSKCKHVGLWLQYNVPMLKFAYESIYNTIF